MVREGQPSGVRQCALLGLSLIVVAAGALLGGCKGNTTAAANVEHRSDKIPEVQAALAVGLAPDADPLVNPVWQNATWHLLVAPANTSHMPPPGRTAVLYDAGNLYVAAICEAAPESENDALSLYLDPKGEGRELMRITTDSDGQTEVTWIRTTTAVAPLDDGAPNKSFPLDVRPDFKIAGLVSHVGKGLVDGRMIWTVTVQVPVAGLPALMQLRPVDAGEAGWKINVVRNMVRRSVAGGGQPEQLQSNLAPVYVNAQAFSPYRMARVTFAPSQEVPAKELQSQK